MAAALLAAPGAAHAEGSHHFDIINNSSKPVSITSPQQRCVKPNQGIWPVTIPPGQRHTFNWEDSNNMMDYGGYGCNGKDKFVAFSISIDGGNYNGYLGITHRELSGHTWYNGQFYAQSINVNQNNGGISGNDGSAPPGYMVALCSHGNNCFGPWSQMEMANKNSYNWPRSYRTEDGWAFQINDP